jgi:hypothetical protein
MQPHALGLLSLAYGFAYGGVVGFFRDTALVFVYPIHPLPQYTLLEFYFASITGAVIFVAFFPSFRYSFIQDSFQETHHNWRLSISSYILLALFYPSFIFLFVESVYRYDDKNVDMFLYRGVFSYGFSGLLTQVLEGVGIHHSIRTLYLRDFV